MPLSKTSSPELLSLKSILALSEQPILLFDNKERLIGFSTAVTQLFPQGTDQIGLVDILGEEVEGFRQWVKVAGESSDRTPIEFSGSVAGANVAWKSQAIFNAQNEEEFIGFCLVGVDYTHREKLETELKQSLRLIEDQQMALDESSIVAMTDQRGVIQYVNDTFCRISGYEREELIGKTHSIVKSGSHSPEFFKGLWGTISRGKVWKGEICNKNKNGEIYWVDTTIVPFVNDKGRPFKYIAIRNDITEKKRMQENLDKERIRVLQAEKLASLGELAAGIAHELGNPAASINAWLDVIESQRERQELDVEFFARMIPKVKKDAARIRDIIRGMLAFARDGSRDPFQLENPLLMVNQIVESCNYKLKVSGIDLKIEVSSPYLSLECRMTEVSQMLINFILNACDAVENLDEKWIRIEVREAGESIEFAITDSGPGISHEVAAQIFTPFFTTKAVGKGTGLGLSISKSIAENHQGTIDLDMDSPHTRFVILLPKRHQS